MFEPKVGESLSNGAVVLDRHYTTERGWTVLCDYGGVQPYVTWRLDQNGNAFWGHYFRELESAQEHFKKHTGQLSLV